MAIGNLVGFPLADDGIYVLSLPSPTSDDIHALMETPAAFLEERLQAGAQKVVFDRKLPIDLMFSYDLPVGYPWIVEGVYHTNTINVRIPRDVLQTGNAASSTSDAPNRLQVTPGNAIDIRLVPSLLVGFAHFDPSDAETPSRKNFARVVTRPGELLTFLEARRGDFSAASFDTITRTDRATDTQVDFVFAPMLTARLQRMPEATGNDDDDDPPPVTGNCIKQVGNLLPARSENRVVFEITSLASIPYIEPDPTPPVDPNPPHPIPPDADDDDPDDGTDKG